MDFDSEMLEVFTASCLEQLADIEQHVLSLEEGGPGLAAHVDAIFRPAHSIKADAAAMGFEHISRLAHLAEDMLHMVRSSRLPISRPLIDALLAVFDCLKRMAETPLSAVDAAPSLMLMNRVLVTAVTASTAAPAAVAPECAAEGEAPLTPGRPEGETRMAQLSIAAAKLDTLVDQVGELSGFQARLSLLAHEYPGLSASSEELDRLLRGLRDQVMALRMVPLRPVFAKLRRVVRDVASQTGKQVVFSVSGEDTELDKSAIEHVHGPLNHILRNAVDHGIEPPARRVAVGKPPEGEVRVAAFQVGGAVEIQIHDDGQGIDPQAVRRAAVARGIAVPDRELSPQEVMELVFMPGVSTSAAVSAYSGRGVGMDAAREGILAMRGAIALESVPGRGTTVSMRIPLSLAILDTLQIAVGRELFFVQIEHLVECLELRRSATPLHAGRGTFTVRGELLPVVCLAAFFDLDAPQKDVAAVVVVRAGDLRVGLIVDKIIGHRQVVLKQIRQVMGPLEGILGGAITEDGSFALVLDIHALTRSCLDDGAMVERRSGEI